MSASAIFSLNDAMRYPLARLPQWVRASILPRPSFVRLPPLATEQRTSRTSQKGQTRN